MQIHGEPKTQTSSSNRKFKFDYTLNTRAINPSIRLPLLTTIFLLISIPDLLIPLADSSTKSSSIISAISKISPFNWLAH